MMLAVGIILYQTIIKLRIEQAILKSTKPAKTESSHARGWTGGTVEAEAVAARVTRRLVREAIEQHLDLREVRGLEAAEESERDGLLVLAAGLEAAE